MRRGVGAVRIGVIACGLAFIATGLAAPVLGPSAGASVVAAVDVGPRSVVDDTVLGAFSTVGGGTNAAVWAMALHGDDTVYAGGSFTNAGGNPAADRIAAWSDVDDTWHAQGSGISTGTVYAVAALGDDTVYAGGDFTNVGGNPSADGIAAWSNTAGSWHALGTGVTGSYGVKAVALAGDDTVYAGGYFTDAGGNPVADKIAAWSNADGAWHALGTGMTGSNTFGVNAVALRGDDTLYAGGKFTTASGVPFTGNIAAWSNADDTWHALGTGVDYDVNALALSGDDTVYAGGYFTDAGGNPAADKIAAWSSADDTWHPLGTGIPGGDVFAVAVDAARGLVYAGGVFNDAGGTAADNVAVWDVGAGEWIALQAAGGQGADGDIVAVTADDSVVYLGGFFTTAGGVPMSSITRWTWDAPSAEAMPATGAHGTLIQVRGSGLVGVSGVRVDGAAVPYTRDDSTTVSVTIPGNLYDGTYSVAVDAVGGTATTSYTVTGSPAPVPFPVSSPGAPTAVAAVAGDGSASVSWVAPADAGSFPVSAYEATSSPGGRSCLVSAPALACEVSGLVNGTGYTFAVRALNGAGWGAESARSNAVTPRAMVRPTIVITGSRDPVDPRMAVVRGVTTGLAGERVTPYVRFAGEGAFTPGRVPRPVADDGTFDWQRRTARRVVVYFACGAVVSNRVVILAR